MTLVCFHIHQAKRFPVHHHLIYTQGLVWSAEYCSLSRGADIRHPDIRYLIPGIAFHVSEFVAMNLDVGDAQIPQDAEGLGRAAMHVEKLPPGGHHYNGAAGAGNAVYTDMFKDLIGVRTHLEKHDGPFVVYFAAPHGDAAGMDAFAAEGQCGIHTPKPAILHQHVRYSTVPGQLPSVRAFTALDADPVIVHGNIAMLDRYIPANIDVDAVGAGRGYGMKLGTDVTAVDQYMAALVQMGGPKAAVVQLNLKQAYIIAAPQKDQPGPVHFQIRPFDVRLLAGVPVCPECFPEIKAVAIQGARTGNAEMVHVIRVDQGCIIIQVVTLHPGRNQRIVIDVVGSLEFGSGLEFQPGMGLEKQGSGHKDPRRNDYGASTCAGSPVNNGLDGFGLHTCAVVHNPVAGDEVLLGFAGKGSQKHAQKKNRFFHKGTFRGCGLEASRPSQV